MSRRQPKILVVAIAALIACATAPVIASAARPSHGDLSPRLAELAKPSVRSAPPGRQAEALALAPRGAGSLLRQGDRVLVEVRFEHGAAAGVDNLRDVGATVIDFSRRYQTATVAVHPTRLFGLVAVPGVAAATEVLVPIASSTCPAGLAISEGDVQLRAAEARASFGVDGGGVIVGVLSDSFDEDELAATDEADDVESGDLPGTANTCAGQSAPVDILEDFSGPDASDEGRAMAQIVHDLAPGSQLSFATAFTGLTAFADNIRELASNGAEVIVDDVSYFEEPFFQEGPVSVAVSDVTADGVSYFSSAGNNNLIAGGRDIASWEADQFRDAGVCPTGAPSYATQCMDFHPEAPVDSTFALRVSAGATLRIALQWAQPWNGVTTDLDAYLLNASNALIAESENFNVTLTQRPFEFLSWENSSGAAQTVRVAINRCDVTCGGGDGASPRLKFILLQNGGGVTESEYPESIGGDTVGPTIFGHNGAASAISTGAIRYNATLEPERFSSRGPVTHYFGPVDDVAPAPQLPAPAELSKPDLVATDCGVTTFFVPTGTPGVFRFCGTSAAAPHGAAVVALMRDANPLLTPEQVRFALTSTALPVGAFGPNAVGAGRIDAVAALDEVADAVPAEDGGGGGGPTAPDGGGSVSEGGDPSPPPGSSGSATRDVVAPRAFFRQRPPRLIRTQFERTRAVFRLGATEDGVAFLCKVDRRPWRPCSRRLIRRFAAGRHVVRITARDPAGNVDRTPAVHRFRVERRGR